MLGKLISKATIGRIGDGLIGASLATLVISFHYRDRAKEELKADFRKHLEQIQYNRSLLNEVVALRETVEELRKKGSNPFTGRDFSAFGDV